MKTAVLFAAASLRLFAQVLPGNSTGVSMGHLHVITPDPEAHRKLWIEVLGGKSVKAGPIEFAMFPGVLVAFRKGESAGGTVGSVVDHLGFAVRDFEGYKTKIEAAAKIVSVNEKTRQFFAEFPGGVIVEFTEDTKQDVPIRHHHVHFATPQIEEMRAWYAKVFGAIPGTRAQFQAADLPGVNLSWKTANAPTAKTQGRVFDHIGFEVSDVEAMCKAAEAAGAKLEGKPMTPPGLGLKVAFLSDPWGARIELTEGLAKLR